VFIRGPEALTFGFVSSTHSFPRARLIPQANFDPGLALLPMVVYM
jgi:hypothetical protein